MSNKKPISDADKALFRDAVGEVKPVKDDKAVQDKPAPQLGKITKQDDKHVMESLLAELSETDLLETGEHLSFTRDGVQKGVLRKLKSGQYSIQGEIDLHGLTLKQARQELSEFLGFAIDNRRLCVRIIHGKGRKQPDKQPRLKPAVNTWLQSHKSVLAFCSAREMDGGTGAVVVLLRKRQE